MRSVFPVFLNLQGRSCLVVGGGAVAARKIKQLLKAEAKVTVIAKRLNTVTESLYKEGKIAYRRQPYRESSLVGMTLVIAATDDKQLNRLIAEQAQAQNILVNVVSTPQLGSFITGTIIERHPVIVSVSTAGAAPILSRLLSMRLETLIPANYGRLAELIAALRLEVKNKLPKLAMRRRFWAEVLQSPIAEYLYTGQEQKAIAQLKRYIAKPLAVPVSKGQVYLVGAGPGDPDLLTFRALRLMQQADVVFYDRLVNPKIVALVNAAAKRYYVGKARDQHTLPQAEISQLLVTHAQQGQRVLRLKGGDPFIFGRGGEEIDLLAAEQIPFQIVPGITAATGCAAYAGIPLTHRDYAQSCLFITAHLKDGKMALNWQQLVQPQQTLLVYMGVHSAAVLCQGLIDHGLKETTPAAVIQHGTTPEQQVYTATVDTLPAILAQYNIKPPSMMIIGEVVALRQQLAWFEVSQRKPNG